MSSSIRFDPPRRRTPIVLASLGALAAIALTVSWWVADLEAPAPPVRPPAAAAALQPVAPAAVAARAGSTVAGRADAPGPRANLVRCAYQQLEVTREGQPPASVCVADPRVTRRGDLRVWFLGAHGPSGGTLELGVAGLQVRSAQLTAPDGQVHRCGDIDGSGDARANGLPPCAGFGIGPRDAQGGRRLRIDGARLEAADGTGLQFSAVLPLRSDEQDVDLACLDDRITVVERGGAVWSLCWSGSSGLATLDDGRRVFSVQGSEGDTLLIGVDAAGVVDQVDLEGLSCHGHRCAGAAIELDGPGVPGGPRADGDAPAPPLRRFVFSGTTLGDSGGGGRSATLSGSLALPAW